LNDAAGVNLSVPLGHDKLALTRRPGDVQRFWLCGEANGIESFARPFKRAAGGIQNEVDFITKFRAENFLPRLLASNDFFLLSDYPLPEPVSTIRADQFFDLQRSPP
jgi:hypothetical protein